MGAQAVLTERIRGPNLAVLVRYKAGVPFEEGLRLANGGNLVIASNARLDKALVGSEEWNQPNVRPVVPALSGTMTGYEEPGNKLGATIEFVDSQTGVRWVFPVPREYQGERDVVLVAEHPDYDLRVDGNNRVVDATSVDLVRDFPTGNGCYFTDPVHGIPTGKAVDSLDDNARYLYRVVSRVGPVARGVGDIYDRRFVGFNVWPSLRLGMAVEAAEDSASSEGAPIRTAITFKDGSELVVDLTERDLLPIIMSLGKPSTKDSEVPLEELPQVKAGGWSAFVRTVKGFFTGN